VKYFLFYMRNGVKKRCGNVVGLYELSTKLSTVSAYFLGNDLRGKVGVCRTFKNGMAFAYRV
jgi:hypothetical protein